ncbi:response regulator [Acetobacteraceae bacterium H6797]|nr:response regulator [Acetobacteraceae bacterium H6797]
MSLAGKNILIVEDEMIVAMDLEDSLRRHGAKVIGPALRLKTALDLAGSAAIDAAVLDVNLNGERSYPVAQLLLERGIPFLFATGYGHVEQEMRFAEVPLLKKPYRSQEVVARLEALLPLTNS